VADCSISLKLRTDFEHITADLLQMFKVSGSEVNVTASHNVSWSKNCYMSETDRFCLLFAIFQQVSNLVTSTGFLSTTKYSSELRHLPIRP